MIGLHETGILQHLKARHFRPQKETHCDPKFTVGSSALGLVDVWPIFAIIGCGVTAAIICVLLETMARGRKKHNVNELHVQDKETAVEDLQISEIYPDMTKAAPSTCSIDTESGLLWARQVNKMP